MDQPVEIDNTPRHDEHVAEIDTAAAADPTIGRRNPLRLAISLAPGGVCYFGANNRLKLIETHYGRLPLLSVIPKPLAHLYLRVLGRARYYYETHYTVWGLRRLVRRFEVIDYTRRIVAEPEKFHATDMVRPGSAAQKCALAAVDWVYTLFPGYVWLLRKPIS